MSLNTFTIRPAVIQDAEIIHQFIRELAAFEQLEHAVTGTVESIQRTLFANHPKAFVLIAEVDHQPVGFALYFYNYSTFLCKHGIYIEDIYVRPEFRGGGYGKKLIEEICKIATEEDCGRVEWWCLDWNKKAIDFYLKLGAEPMVDWTVYRLKKEELQKIASA